MTYRELRAKLNSASEFLLNKPAIVRLHVDGRFYEGEVSFGPFEDWPVLDVPDSEMVQG